MSAQSSYLNKKGLTVKDLVTIGIFTARVFDSLFIANSF